MAEQNLPPSRGGRGSLLLQAALNSKFKQPGSSIHQESSSVSSGILQSRLLPLASEESSLMQNLDVPSCTVPSAIRSSSPALDLSVLEAALSSKASSGYISGHANIDVTCGSSSESKSSGGRGMRLANILKQQKEETSSQPIGRVSIGRGELLQSLKSQSKSASVSDSGDSHDKSLSGSITSEEVVAPLSYKGSTGTKFNASCNYIRIYIDPEKVVYEYDVKFSPPVDAKNLRFQLLNSQKDKIGNTKSFDGAKLWLPLRMPNKITELQAQSKHTGEFIKISIVYKSQTTMHKSIQLYNVLFNRVMKVLQMVLVGRNYFSPQASVMIPHHKLEIWPGYVTSAQHMEGGLMLCVDVSHRVLRTNTVYSVMESFIRTQQSNFKEAVSKVLIGAVVLTRYNNKTYRIDDILFDSNAKSTFTSSRGEEMSYIQYYKNAYNIDINDPNQPLLLHKVKKKEQKDADVDKFICLVPELCFMTGLTDDMRADFRIMKDLAQHTRITPNSRQACLRKYIKNVNDTPEARQILADWGLVLSDDTVQTDGRIVPVESIVFGNKQVDNVQNADWGREACREKVIMPVDLKANRWAVMYTARDEARARKFVETMRQVTNFMGIMVGEPKMEKLNSDNTDSYVSGIKRLYSDQLQIVVIIFPTQREDRYSAVKRICSAELGLPSQCINSRTISQEQKLRSVTQKIALQINCKLGGELWALKIPMNGLMVCGVDVYHDPVRRGNSVVGFVASLNQTLTRYYSFANSQRPGEEVISGMKISMLEALRNYYEENHAMPKTIVMFRDGVSDGMLDLTREHEIPQIATIFRNFDSYEPKLYFIVVQKRINTRIFASLGGSALGNPPPGSIIDHTITKRMYYDFLLVSQHVRQGTVSPTHYVVVHDSGSLKPDNLQRLTYKLTHLYYNWPGTVRVPAPCQYAHKLAYLVGENMRKEPHPILSKKLHFL